jgi:hypothetical protein
LRIIGGKKRSKIAFYQGTGCRVQGTEILILIPQQDRNNRWFLKGLAKD